MGSLTSPPKATPPQVVYLPAAASYTAPAVTDAANAEKRRNVANAASNSTNLTGPSGLSTPANTGGKTLLGQ